LRNPFIYIDFTHFHPFDIVYLRIVAGIDRYPRKVVRAMGKAKLEKRSKVKPFIKVVNFNHIMPTRYTVDFDLKKMVDESALDADANRIETKKQLKKLFEDKYKTQTAKSDKKAVGVQYFFNKLRF
jgi:large subunit ribosomal protein L27e